MSDFDKLMGELNQLAADQGEMAKALPADNGEDEAKIQAAAAEGGDGDADDNGGKPDGDADDKGDCKPMAKSFTLTLEDGTVVEAQDGAEMVKALSERVEASEANFAKAMGSAVELIKGQAELIKSMQGQLAKLSGEGRGRKAVVSVVEKPDPAANTMAKSLTPDGMTSEQFFAKAFAAQREGKISGTEIAVAETYLNRGQAIPEHIVQRVVS